jgi:hypothetical protein
MQKQTSLDALLVCDMAWCVCCLAALAVPDTVFNIIGST